MNLASLLNLGAGRLLVKVYQGVPTVSVDTAPPTISPEREAEAAHARDALAEVERLSLAERIYVDDETIDRLRYQATIDREPPHRLVMSGRLRDDGNAELVVVAAGRADFTVFEDERGVPLFSVDGLCGQMPELVVS